MNKTLKIVIVIVIIIIALFTLFYFIGGKETQSEGNLSSSDTETSSVNVSNNSQINTDTAFLGTLEYLKSMKIEASIFLSATFKNLKDNTVIIESDGIIGRENPFAPIAGMEQSLNLIPLTQTVATSTQSTINVLPPKN